MRTILRTIPLSALLLAACVSGVAAQQQYPSSFTPRLAAQPAVRDALAWLERNFPAQVEEWIRVTEIPAPSTQEQRRGAYVRQEMEKAGLEVTVDSIGNVTGRRRGTGGGPTVVFAGHMDTVHPIDTDVRVRREGDTLRAPGVFDDTAGLVDLLNVVRALNAAGVRTRGDLVIVGTVQEELGLRGMDYWLAHNPRPDLVVAVDGGLGPVNYGALGIYWTRYHFSGEGSHTNTSAGRPHPARALADAVRSIYEIQVPEGRGGAVYNVGMLAGGKIFNAIPENVSFTMDLRSVNPALLDSLNAEIEARVARAAEAHRVRWSKEEVQRLRAGGTAEMLRERRAHPIVQTALDVHRFVGVEASAEASGSTDANVAVTRGIPAIAVGRGRGGNQHTLSEWADVPSTLTATKMLLLLAVSLAGVG
ncbi:MAG TPA: M20/M25/M40 family metallo-hydrolase [Longimicrobium sp.]|jgi:acetylornithine deacetylase/succinyl-diaminopimelate desuccinylase-like protein